ncbi:MAG: GNAT family N-acetyltransferase [Balneolales bacterium]
MGLFNRSISNESLIIRIAVAKDIPLLINVIEDVFDEFGFIFDANEELPDFIGFNKYYGNSDRKLFVVEHENKLAGCGALNISNNQCEIRRVYVARKFRGQGFGKNIVNHLINQAKATDAIKLSLWTDTRFTVAHKLYDSLGFIRFEKVRPLQDVNHSYEIYYEMTLKQK